MSTEVSHNTQPFLGILVFDGPLVHSLGRDKLVTIARAIIVVENGKITHVNESSGGEEVSWHIGNRSYKLRKLEKGEFLCPGFVDLHTHAPQFPNTGLGLDLPLLEWLSKYTFPLEMRYEDEVFAKNVYNDVVKTTLSTGTTTACYYGTIHRRSTNLLAQTAASRGQRALIGKVNMNRNSSEKYVETRAESIEETKQFIKDVMALNNSLVEPIITPRFAIACDMGLLQELSEIAKEHDLYIQTHISENKDEVAYTKQIFPEQANYAEVYNAAGLLTDKTILAHGIYLSEEEQKVIASKGTAVAHCPNSNTWLKSGICDVRSLFKNNVKVGLGTDIGAGSVCSMIDAMRSALAASINKSFASPEYQPLTYPEVFYLATLGGAQALNKDKTIGSFEVGKDFDALVIDMERRDQPETASPTFALPQHNLLERLEKLIYSGDDRNVTEVYVKGRLVHSRTCCT